MMDTALSSVEVEDSFYNGCLGAPKYILAPMVSQSELAWRLLARKHGADLCYTPMFHASVFNKDRTYRKENLTEFVHEDDHPLLVQFCANDPEVLLTAAQLSIPYCEGIDLNLGCPQTIAKQGHYGAYLQDEWDLVHKMVRKVSLHDIPITCKVRIFEDLRRTVDYARMLEAAGCKVLAVHGRTREQKGRFTGIASWDHIRTVRASISIPVFANGNIQYFGDVEECLKLTNAHGVMTAEGHLHNPCIFEDRQPPTWELAYEYLDIVEKYNPGTSSVRGHMFKLLHHSMNTFLDIRAKLSKAVSVQSFRDVIDAVKSRCEEQHAAYLADPCAFGSSDLPFPHWICQPYVRPKPDEPNLKRQHDLDAEVAQSKRKRKLLNKLKGVDNQSRRRVFDLCTCQNPMSNKCDYNLCKRCCRTESRANMRECQGHRFFYRKPVQTSVEDDPDKQ